MEQEDNWSGLRPGVNVGHVQHTGPNPPLGAKCSEAAGNSRGLVWAIEFRVRRDGQAERRDGNRGCRRFQDGPAALIKVV